MSPKNSPPPQRPMTRRELEARIIAKAWKNPTYAQRLTSDAKAVLQDELRALDPSIALPASLAVQVHQEDPDTFHLVVPRNPDDISLGEVLGDELDAVAAQSIAVVVVAAGAVVVTAAAAANVAGAANGVGAANAAVTANVAANFNAVS